MKHKLIYHTHVSPSSQQTTHAVILRSGEYNLPTELSGLARNGLSITCNRETLDQVLPNSGSVSPRQPKCVALSFNLERKGNDGSKVIEALCELYCVRRLSRDVFQLEVMFKVLADQDQQALDRYIDRQFKSRAA